MKELCTKFQSDKEKRALVLDGESFFRSELSETVNRIAERRDLRLITVSGPSCAGKTTSSAKLESALEEHGYLVHVISIDDFFLDREYLIARARERGLPPDFDSPDTIDFSALSDAIDAIVAGKSHKLPVFSFQEGRRIGYRTLEPTHARDVYLIEGIQAVYPEVLSCFGKTDFVSLFVCPEIELSLGDDRISATDVRFLRRLVRDAKFRNATPEFTFTLWETVRENEEKNIFPNLAHVQYRINSYLAYEPYVIAPYAKGLLQAIPKESRHAPAAERYLRILKSIPEISDDCLPADSLFREFIG